MTDELLKLERELYLKPRAAARVLGIAYSTYMGYREGVRPLPQYVRYHAQAIMALPEAVRSEIVEVRIGG